MTVFSPAAGYQTSLIQNPNNRAKDYDAHLDIADWLSKRNPARLARASCTKLEIPDGGLNLDPENADEVPGTSLYRLDGFISVGGHSSFSVCFIIEFCNIDY